MSYTLWDGTETAALNAASVAFARSNGPNNNGCTFNLSGIPAGMTVDVQVCSPPSGKAADPITGGFASVSAMDTAFNTVTTLTRDTNGNASYTDIGNSAFCRLKVSAFSSGSMPVGVVQR